MGQALLRRATEAGVSPTGADVRMSEPPRVSCDTEMLSGKKVCGVLGSKRQDRRPSERELQGQGVLTGAFRVLGKLVSRETDEERMSKCVWGRGGPSA